MNLSFIKLDINIMNDTKIKLIRKLPEGDSLLVLWIGLLCLAMKSGRPGTLEIGEGLPFTDETLSVELDIPVNTVRLGLKTFVSFKMIEVWDSGDTFIINFEKHQELSKIEKAKEISRASSRKFRQKLLIGDGHVTISDETDVTESDETDKDKEIELEEEKNLPDSTESGTLEFYLTKKKRKLTGKRLETFNKFWEVFNFKKSKADAADSWLDIPMLTDKLVSEILIAAELESNNRQSLIDKGSTPKWPQGWITSRRWEDEINTSQKTTDTGCDLPTL